jgi:aminoglycoside phosphotransferase (APT) family kinase protein
VSQSTAHSVLPVGTDQLRAALGAALGSYFGAARSIVGLERRPSAFSSSFALEELDVQLDDGRVLHLMFKDLSRRGLLPEARRGKPPFLYNPLREIETYRKILPALPLSTPVFYGAAVDPAAGRYWLFLERVPGVELYQEGELSEWQEAARWLAGLHSHFAPEAAALAQPEASHLIHHDADFYRLWLRRAQRFMRRPDPSSSDADRCSLDLLAQRYHRVVERLAALPATFIHGEFYASNILVQKTPGGVRVCPVDWEMAAVGPGLLDLAALTAGQWNEAERAALALAYREGLAPGYPGRVSDDDFLESLDYCRLHLAMQWLGWSAQWSPPTEHSQDWLAEARLLAEKLKL